MAAGVRMTVRTQLVEMMRRAKRSLNHILQYGTRKLALASFRSYRSPCLLVGGAVSLATGFCDLDAWHMHMRFSEYWRGVDFADLGPLQLPWWWAYAFSVARVAVGCFLIGWVAREVKER